MKSVVHMYIVFLNSEGISANPNDSQLYQAVINIQQKKLHLQKAPNP